MKSMDLTVSLDDALLERASRAARSRGFSLGALLTRFVESLAAEPSPEAVADELLRLMREHAGHSGGDLVTRADAYEGRL